MTGLDDLAPRIDADLRALADRSVPAMRKERRRWSARLRSQPAADVLALALALFERFGHRWIACQVRSKLTTGRKHEPSPARTTKAAREGLTRTATSGVPRAGPVDSDGPDARS